MDFLGAVNRVLVNAYIIKGDDDLLTNFNDNQHEATLRVAKNAIQTELNGLLSFFSIDYERAQSVGTLTTVVGQRTYAMPANFVRFWGDNPYLVDPANDSDRLYEWKGGENSLRRQITDYKNSEGKENWWYWSQNTSKQIGLYQVPDAIRTYEFEYEQDRSVANSTDPIPFQTEAESQAFADMASRRFVYMVEDGLNLVDLAQDGEYTMAQGTLMNYMSHRDPKKHYGKSYR
ncbi:MAG: hypothetical protein ACR2PH_04885 [Desulfobulbia bacterium]